MAKRIVDEEMRFSIVVNGNEAQKEIFELEKSTRELTASNKELKAEKARLIAQGKKESEEYQRVNKAIRENNAVIKTNKARMNELQEQVGLTGLTMRQLSQRASQLKLQLLNMVPGSAEFERLQGELKETELRMQELRNSARATKTSVGSIADGFNRYAALGASIIAGATGIVLSLQKMIDYNGKLSDSQSDVMKTTGMTKEEVDELTKSFGMMKTRTARIELLKLAEDAGRLGITGVKNLRDYVNEANKLKVALGDDLSDEQIKEVGKMTDIYKVGAQTGRDFAGSMLSLGSAINEVSASGANAAPFLVDYLKRQAGIAVQAKLSADQNIGYAATFDEIGQSVEISATAMNKVWMDLFDDTATYAKIAGMSLKDFNNLLQTDSNEAMLRFLEGLNGNNEGLTVMVEKLKDLDVGGARGAQALSALAGSTDKVRERQRLANEALREGTSLTDEYNIKNNNLAATLDKVKKRMVGAFSSPVIVANLTGLLQFFGKLTGAIEDVNEAFAEESAMAYENAKANRQLANESSALLDEYVSLTREGITPTKEEKQRLEVITLQLKDRLGESVLMIDEETGAFKLNTDAVREQIKIKRLAADEEAATLASRLKGTQEEIKLLKDKNAPIQREYDLREKYFKQTNAAELKAIENNSYLTAMEKQQMKERLEGYKEMDRARIKLTNANDAIYQQEVRRKDLLEKLKELNYSEGDVDLMFPDQADAEPNGPKEGETKIVGDQLYRFTGGKWVAVKTPGGGDPSSPYDPSRDQAELRRIQEENDRLKASLINDSFQKEIALEEANHQAKIAKLKEQMADEAELKGMSPEARAIAIQKNQALNDQIELEEQSHQYRIGAIIQKGLQEQFRQEQEQYERERREREAAHNLEMAALGNNEEAKKRLQEQFNREEAEREARHLEELITRMRSIMESGDFKGFELELLTDEQKQELLDFLDKAGLKLSELLNLASNTGEDGSDAGGPSATGDFASNVDILGMSPDQWIATFDNLDTTKGKIEAAQVAVQTMMQAWSMYSNYMNQREQVEMRKFEDAQRRKEDALKRQLDSGYVNQRQYNRALEAMEKEAAKKRAEMEYKQAKREKAMNMAAAVSSTALAVLNAMQTKPFVPLGLIMASIAGAMGAAQVAMIASTPLPAKGYEDGLYPVQREQDGKVFQARNGGNLQSGLYSKPTMLVAEKDPEMIIDGNAWKKMDPDVKNSIYRELGRMGRVPGYEGGYYPEMRKVEASESSAESSSGDYQLFIAALNRNSSVMERLEKSGLQAYLVRNMENAKKLQDDIDDYNKLRNANKR